VHQIAIIPTKSFRPTYKPTAVRHTMKVTIREWNAVAAWRWDMPDDDVCGICRNPYDSTCSKCKFPGDECPLRKLRLDEPRRMSSDATQYLENATTPSTWYVTLPLATPAAPLTATQHCIFSWLKQESSLEKCPMCRQRKYLPAK
jgi:anaphase-promoting complex subunit 11